MKGRPFLVVYLENTLSLMLKYSLFIARVISVEHSHKLVTYINSLSAL